MSKGDELAPIEISDFTPGIKQVASPNHPDGAALEKGTYGCIATQSGALVPLPEYTEKRITLNPESYGYTADTDFWLIGAFAADPVYSLDLSNPTPVGPDQKNTDIYFALQTWELGANNAQWYLQSYGSPTGGTIDIKVTPLTAGVRGTPEIATVAYNASNATIDSALEALPSVGSGNVTVSGTGPLSAGNQLTIEFTNGNSYNLGVSWYGTLTGGTNAYVATSQAQGADNVTYDVGRLCLSRENPTTEQILTATEAGAYEVLTRPKTCDFGASRSNANDPTQVGPSVIGFVVDEYARIFPDDSNPTLQSTAKMGEDSLNVAAEDQPFLFNTNLVMHQGRAVVFPTVFTAMGILETYAQNESMWWTEPNDLTSLEGNLGDKYLNFVVGSENPTGYMVMESLTANELLLIKTKGGAILLRGDLDNSAASTLPYVQSTGQSLNRGSTTPVGFMYPVDGGGLWLWKGGDVSQHISKDMDPEFWRPDYSQTAYGTNFTQMCRWQELVLLPNNWVFDTDYNGYWRMEPIDDLPDGTNPVLDDDDDPTPATARQETFFRWVADWKGRWAYGFPETYSSLPSDAFCREYDSTTKRNLFSWQSHPIASTIDTIVDVHELVLTASGNGQVDWIVRSDFTGDEDTGTIDVAQESGVSEDIPFLIRTRVGVQGSHIQIKLTSRGVGNQAAPTIHGVKLLVREGQHVQRSYDEKQVGAQVREHSSAFASSNS